MLLRRLVVTVLLLATTAPAVADDDVKIDGDAPKYAFGKPDDLKDIKTVEWKANAEAGLVLTAGNSHTTTATAGVKISRKEGNNKLAIEGNATYATSTVRVINDLNGNGLIDGPNEISDQTTVTAETLNAKLRYDRFLAESDSVYIAALASRDVPAGLRSAVGGQVGYSRRLYKSKRTESLAELGYDVSRVHQASGAPLILHSARGFVGLKSEVHTGTQIDTSLEALTNLVAVTLPTMEDGGAFQVTRVNYKLAIAAKLSKNLAAQTSVDLHYAHRPGPLPLKNLAPGFVPVADPLDVIVKATLLYSFF